uniref:Uncharacterized protein n=1 Tax=Ditylenchus dipsaci TaxID=166011 RepID=A0A915DGM9_9BILA
MIFCLIFSNFYAVALASPIRAALSLQHPLHGDHYRRKRSHRHIALGAFGAAVAMTSLLCLRKLLPQTPPQSLLQYGYKRK